MTRRHAHAIAVAVVVLGVLGSRTASAQFFIEPEIGFRGVTADWKKLPIPTGDPSFTVDVKGKVLGPGVTFGGTAGFHVSPNLAIIGSANIGIHGKPDNQDFKVTDLSTGNSADSSFQVIDSGVTFEAMAGGRFYPLAGTGGSPVQPYVGVGLGLAGIGWTYVTEVGGPIRGEDSDAVAGLLLAGEGGLDYSMSPMLKLGVFGRLSFVRWGSESSEGLDTSNLAGVGLSVGGRIGLHF